MVPEPVLEPPIKPPTVSTSVVPVREPLTRALTAGTYIARLRAISFVLVKLLRHGPIDLKLLRNKPK